eukprot:gnl/TRDRNA2_/TRDRNA2_41162_c0_seq1.p2 gnl/TRDRNA2_/TRDRNA2_41162_c0~~gnl/TRDRNA2_/TRDRNA2_41162_c0_seq1.p2  ORF type:complete len:141 (+),score=12.18 gnl/TRDRNA2_/TRDRNA2_41162_c0_seq1:99-521(+)
MSQLNILGTKLEKCSRPDDPVTGWYRDGYAAYDPGDPGCHIVAAELTLDFLEFTRSRGNPLYKPPWYIRWFCGFQGLEPGQRWALCISRWKEAHDAGCAPPIIACATHERSLDYVSKDVLLSYAIDVTNQNDGYSKLMGS